MQTVPQEQTSLAELDALLTEGEQLLADIKALLARGEHWLGSED